MCYCVDTETGIKLNNREMFPERERDTFNCSAVQQCPDRDCTKVCVNGYDLDREGCETCKCQKAPRVESCETITEVVAAGCACACVEVVDVPSGTPRSRMTKGCPRCRESCNGTTTEEVSPELAAQCPVVSECGINETDLSVVLSVGPHGSDKCVAPLPPDAECMVEAPPAPIEGRTGRRRKPAGAKERAAVGLVGRVSTPCRSGYVCRRVGLKEMRCQPEDPNGPCIQRRDNLTNPDPYVDCDDNGNFKPLQCGPMADTRRSRSREVCYCVHPNGSIVEGTEERVRPGRRMPDCERRVFRNCDVPGLQRGRGRRRYHVHHGETYFDAEGCRTCECRDGNATAYCGEPRNCTVVSEGTADCALSEESGGGAIPHGAMRRFGCKICGCRNGRLRCARPRCPEEEEEEEEDSCRACDGGPPDPVCGPNGINYRSLCTAVNCSGIPPANLEKGPCQSLDVCERFPCDEGQTCVRRGGAACLSRRGCPPEVLRRCVDLEDLQCPANETVFGIAENVVCGTDNNTYPSVCSLLQRTSGVRVAHAGACDIPECRSGPVCGTDGVTYPNICVLRSWGTARLDYVGDCGNEGLPRDAHCDNIRGAGRCTHNMQNCPFNLVQPQDACCPICGGTITVAIDREVLDDVSETDPESVTVDSFVERMTDIEVFSEVEGNCTVEATVTSTGDMELVLVAGSPEDAMSSELCNRLAEEIADLVNSDIDPLRETTPEEESEAGGIVELPQVYEFAMAAATAPVIVEETTDATDTTDATTEGGAGFLAPSFLVTMAILLSGLLLLW